MLDYKWSKKLTKVVYWHSNCSTWTLLFSHRAILEQRSLCFEHLRDPDSREVRDLSRPVPERKHSCQTDSKSLGPELPASVGNVSEITVARLMGVNTVADGERLRPAQQKGYSTGEKSWLLLATLSSFVVYSLHYRAQSSTSRDNIVVKISKNSALVTDIFSLLQQWNFVVISLFWNDWWEGKTPKCYLHE